MKKLSFKLRELCRKYNEAAAYKKYMDMRGK